MSVLSGASIRQRVASDPTFGIEPFVEDAVQPASYDFHLSDKFLLLPKMEAAGGRLIFPDVFESFTPNAVDQDRIWINPNEFFLALTVEKFTLSADVCAQVKAKSSIGRIGIQVCGDAGWIDPGFKGRIVLELRSFNPVPVKLYAGMPIGQIVFMHTDALGVKVDTGTIPETYSGHYGDQSDFAIRQWKTSLVKVYRKSVAVFNEYINP